MCEFILSYIIILYTLISFMYNIVARLEPVTLCKITVAVLQSAVVSLTKQRACVRGLSRVFHGSSVCITSNLKAEIFGFVMINTVVISAKKLNKNTSDANYQIKHSSCENTNKTIYVEPFCSLMCIYHP